MDFRATPVNVVVLLLVAFAIYALYCLSKNKLDSNIPLLFYVSLVGLMNCTDRSVNTYLFVTGFILALMLRFEFMNRAFTRFVLGAEMLTLSAIAGFFLADIFNLRPEMIGLRF